ncbi:MAG: ATP-binding protein [Ramlibacter sp.]
MPDPTSAAGQRADEFLAGGGELGHLTRSHDWAATTLGPAAQWPRSLKTAVRIMLTSRQPIWIGWGPELVYLYNDPYKAIIGGKHPWALGKPTATVWSEIWRDIEPLLATAMAGDGTYVENQLLIMERNGYPEETYYTFSYSPIPGDDGAPAGIICANTDETQRVIGERQMALLREVAARTADARSPEQAGRQCIAALASDPHDVPFALLYLAAPGEQRMHLVAATGIAAGHAAAPETLDPSGAPWGAAIGHQPGLPAPLPLDPRLGPWPAGAWSEPARQAVVLPLPAAGDSGSHGVLVVGLSPVRLFDDGYRDFLQLVAKQAAAGVANAEAWEAERRRAEALAAIDRAKTAFFSNVSHEFRTPLTLMLGPLEDALADRAELPERHGQLLDVAHRNSLRLLRLVNTLLDFSRIEAGRAQAAFQPTALAEFTRELASNFETVTARAGLALEIDCAPLPQPVFVDQGMWEKIVLNLLSNAFKFTFEGRISVRTAPSADGRHAVLEVADTGVGVPEHELPRLFERFHRVQGQQSRSFEGSGIGLALVQELVRQHGGSIAAESTPGRGTTFRVAIPFGREHLPAAQLLAAPDTAAPDAARADAFIEEALRWLPDTGTRVAIDGDETRAPQPAGSERARIVVADDNTDMREYVARLLGARWDVVAASNGQEALDAIRAGKPDLVLTDVMMPVLDGFGLLRAVRADPALSDLPVVMLSARAGEEARVGGLEAGADDYLVKPFSARELVARVRSNLDLARVRREAQAVLRESEARFRNMADHAPVMMWVTDASGSCSYLNRRWYEFTGQEREQALGFGWLDATHPDDHAGAEAAFLDANARRVPFRVEYRLRRFDGVYRWAIDAAAPRFTEDGDYLGYVGSVIDITERKEAEQLLQELNRQLARRVAEAGEQDRRKNEFLATLAHELRNPLAPLRNGVELIKRQGAAQPNRTPEVLAMMERQLAHMVRLVDDLMDIARVSRGKVELRQERVALAAVVQSAVETCRPLLDRARHTLAVDLPPHPVWLHGDPTRLAQVLANVMNNAAKYTPSGGHIAVRGRAVGATVVIEVEDNGEGIAPELAAQVFDLFVQGPQTIAAAQGGLGIGLSLVRKLVELHGGVVELHSAGPGQGTTVRITLPAAAHDDGEPLAPAGGAAEGEPSAGGRRVLVVDDNVDAAESLGMLLTGGGHQIRVVHSGHAAVEAAAAFRPDLVFLDIGLPDLSGYEVAASLRRSHPRNGMRIVALTGWGNEEAREKSAESGFDLHLTKPVPMEVLRHLLDERTE